MTREDKAAGAAREDGFREGLKEVGKELEESCLRRAKFTMESGYEQAVDLLEKEHDIDIISCATDTIAAGAIEAIAQYSPERKIQVTGFGDNQFLKAVSSPSCAFFLILSSPVTALHLLFHLSDMQNVPFGSPL